MSSITVNIYNLTSDPLQLTGDFGSDWSNVQTGAVVQPGGILTTAAMMGLPGPYETDHWGWLYFMDTTSRQNYQAFILCRTNTNPGGHEPPKTAVGLRQTSTDPKNPNPSPVAGAGYNLSAFASDGSGAVNMTFRSLDTTT